MEVADFLSPRERENTIDIDDGTKLKYSDGIEKPWLFYPVNDAIIISNE